MISRPYTRRSVLAAMTLLLVSACAGAGTPSADGTAGGSDEPDRRLVRTLDRVLIQKQTHAEDIAVLRVWAYGTVTTGGWSAPKLEEEAYDLTPDGYALLRFTAQPPSGMASQAISDIRAVTALTVDPTKLNGVKIRTAEGMTTLHHPGPAFQDVDDLSN
ncbi:hypothetical protein CKO28_20465 [Rhodovibrio sodomensis]|uniref:Lipoprotein n=1 Tax=Rhodovibrio sodomensis TaxID=1088 RepID=A0ABS1DK92_9PROT|nr:hypothetical protein [Rhodovibrio sodomensis]MBK1670401.1 hypothetical protein [Rhodovibrio sodomensis]